MNIHAVPKASRTRTVRIDELRGALRSVGDRLGDLIRAEGDVVAVSMSEPIDVAAQKEGHKKMQGALHSFISSARTYWNYLKQLTQTTQNESWLEERLGSNPLCRFHRELANQGLHDYPTEPGVEQKFNVAFDPIN